jgi:hypothetical protein
VTFNREGHANWPTRLQVELYNGNWKLINTYCITWNMLKIYLNLILNILKKRTRLRLTTLRLIYVD